MIKIIAAVLIGAVARFAGCAMLAADKIATARREARAYAHLMRREVGMCERLVRQFMSAYQDEDTVAIIAVYNKAKRLMGGGEADAESL